MRNIILLALVSCVSGSTPPGGMCDDSCLHGGLNKWNPDSESCECNCLNKWSGPTCENCVGYGGPDCNECADEEEINYPSCEKCRVEVQCSGHATSVSANSKKDKCDCSCKDAWSGEECNTCDSSSCPAHSTGKQTGSLCTCVCENYWSGSNCDVCPDEYESGDCLTCAASYVKEADSCRKCTAARDCSNKATNVGSNSARSKCTCSCSPGYGGDSCEKCADGYVGYPNCQQCSNFDKCNNNAERITSEGNKCICHCKFGFGGTTCGECDEGHINYPACTECTTTKHCSSRATKVTSQGNKCVCTCRNKWSGDKCSTCLAPYGGDDCNSCDEEHIGYPSCTQVCNLAGCGGSSLATRGYANSARTKCTCDCLDDYEGETCNQCKAGLVGSPPNCQNCVLGSSACVQGHASDITSNDARTKCVCVCLDNYEGDDCGKCHVGYIEYPTCTQCTSKKHCSDHAKSVTSNSAQSGCTCTCRNKYEGATCAQCPSKYEGDCDKCALGYVKYPECKECTIAEHCSGHASAVSSNSRRTACSCTCSEGYEGSKCNKCADGYINYPTCTKCDLAAECGDRATDVFSNQARDTCECVCKPQYEGIKCDKCSQSYIGTVPACIECNNADHCYGHADSVSADDARMACKCNCKNYWMEEGNCQTCNSTYGGADCDRCADPKGILPSCNQCNSDEHCNGHASSATPKGDGSGTCVCACRNKWEGDTCKECPAKYDPNQDCNACANGLVGFPDCRECTVEKDCTGHAESVKGDPTGTKCLCQGSWLCPGNIWNETCTCQDPSDQKHCPCGVQGCQFSGSCNNGWSGLNCNYCHSRFYGTDCNQCNDNYIRYPWCRSCMEGGLVAAMQRYGCHADRTSSVISNFDKSDCQCGCKAKYETVDYSSEPCDRCAYGYKNYPGCERCDVSLHCAGNAISVGSDTNRTSCVCHCKDGFESTENGLQGCDCCAPGHYGYPDCEQCTIQKHCSGNAISVMDNGESTYPLSRTGCNCTCYGMWEGEDCSVCPAKYAGDCDQCAPGRIVYPYCFECTDASHCNGHSSSVAPDASQQACVCECKNGWGGSHGTCRSCESPYKGTECNECDNGGSMPDCNQQCTVHSQCSNHAFGVKEVGGEYVLNHSHNHTQVPMRLPTQLGRQRLLCLPTHVGWHRLQ